MTELTQHQEDTIREVAEEVERFAVATADFRPNREAARLRSVLPKPRFEVRQWSGGWYPYDTIADICGINLPTCEDAKRTVVIYEEAYR